MFSGKKMSAVSTLIPSSLSRNNVDAVLGNQREMQLVFCDKLIELGVVYDHFRHRKMGAPTHVLQYTYY